MHSHPLPCASTGICLTQQWASPGSYTSRKLFYSLQKKMFSASIAPLNWLLMVKGGPSALLCFCSPWEHKLSRSHSQKSSLLEKQETREESELLKPFLIAKCASSNHRLFFLTTTLCGIRMTFQGMMLTQRIPHTSHLLSELNMNGYFWSNKKDFPILCLPMFIY